MMIFLKVDAAIVLLLKDLSLECNVPGVDC
jgi:hypothetical protein